MLQRQLLLRLLGLSTIFILAVLWVTRTQPPYKGQTPYLKGSKAWPDSLIKVLPRTQKLGQLIVFTPDFSQPNTETELVDLTRSGMLGGGHFQGLSLLHYLFFLDSLQQQAPLPLFSFSDNQVLHNNQLSDATPLPPPHVLSAIPTDQLPDNLATLYVDQAVSLGLNIVAPFNLQQPWRDSTHAFDLLNQLLKKHIIAGARGLQTYFPQLPDTSSQLQASLLPLKQLVDRGLGLVILDNRLPGTEDIDQLPPRFFRTYLQKTIGFEGLVAGRISRETPLEYLLKAGVDLFLTDQPPGQIVQRLENALEAGSYTRSAMRQSLEKTLLAKQWMYGSIVSEVPAAQYLPIQASIPAHSEPQTPNRRNVEAIWQHFKETDWSAYNFALREQAVALPDNSRGLLPWIHLRQQRFYLLNTGRNTFSAFAQIFEKYAPLTGANLLPPPDSTTHTPPVVVALMDSHSPDIQTDTLFYRQLKDLNNQYTLVVVNFGAPHLLRGLDSGITRIQTFDVHPQTQALAAEVFFGGRAALGKWPTYLSTLRNTGTDYVTTPTRLAYSGSSHTQDLSDKLRAIDAIAQSAIQRARMPGCQILVAHKGIVVYNKSHGQPTYTSTLPVRSNHLYDIASITKIASTTLLLMHYWEQGAIRLQDPIAQHVPWLKSTAVGRIPIWRLLSHQSGLPPAIPVSRYIKLRKFSPRKCDPYFCTRKRGTYTLPVAQNLYFNSRYIVDIQKTIAQIRPRKERVYRYSDLNFWLLQQAIESVGGKSLDLLSQEILYQPLGLRHIAFQPSKRFPLYQLIPTEREQEWRKQLIHGYVHDPAAALLGGVSGHAGLFANAEDLATIMQLLLNQGTYGGVRLFKPETVAHFTQTQVGKRALGFDRPSNENKFKYVPNINPLSYGHTGFTGGCTWVDPEHQLVYIFLSNRVYPTARAKEFNRERVRQQILGTIYTALEP